MEGKTLFDKSHAILKLMLVVMTALWLGLYLTNQSSYLYTGIFVGSVLFSVGWLNLDALDYKGGKLRKLSHPLNIIVSMTPLIAGIMTHYKLISEDSFHLILFYVGFPYSLLISPGNVNSRIGKIKVKLFTKNGLVKRPDGHQKRNRC